MPPSLGDATATGRTLRGVPERRERQPLPGGQIEPAGLHRREHVVVVGRVDHDRDRAVVLRAGPHHRGAADVDLLDDFGRARAGGHRLAERVQVDDEQLERLDAQPDDRLDVLRVVLVGQQAGVHVRVQRLHPPAEDLREPGHLVDRRDRDAQVADPRRGRAGRDDLDAGRVQAARQVLDAGLVVHADQRTADVDLGHVISRQS